MPQTTLHVKYSEPVPQLKMVSARGENLFKKKPVFSAGMTEAEVISKAQAGNVSWFEALYARHKRRIFSLCLRMTGNHAQAEDLTQEAFLQLYRKIASFRGESAFSTWLHRLSVNIVLMTFRKRGVAEVSLEQTLEPQQEEGPVKEMGMKDDVLHGSIDRLTLEKAITGLPSGYRIIFVLHDIEGYEHKRLQK